VRPHRGEFRVRHGACERERATDQPHREHGAGARHERRHDDRDEEDAAADDIRNDDRGGVERPEPALETESTAGCVGR
jgi:hypothetical protein